MSADNTQPEMNEEMWNGSTDPLAMIRYLETAGCYLELEPFFTNCFDRIRHEIQNATVMAAAFPAGADVDEIVDSTRAVIEEMIGRLETIDLQSEAWEKLNREIVFSKAVLARVYHDFGEANRFLSGYLIEIADDAEVEARLQADFLRTAFPYPYEPPEDDWSMPIFGKEST